MMYPSCYFSFALLLLLLLSEATSTNNNYGTLQLSSLLPNQPSTAHCNNKSLHSQVGLDGGGESSSSSSSSSLKVVHSYDPCATTTHRSTYPTLTQILTQDKLRRRKVQRQSEDAAAGATLPAESGVNYNTWGYLVSVHIGDPPKTLLLRLDTGSDLTWTQCSPCTKKCYEQKLPIFDPKGSKTYSNNISCHSTLCSDLKSYTEYKGDICSSSSTCMYGIEYGDTSFSVGDLARERLSLMTGSSSDAIDNFIFGCGQNNSMYFYEISGLLGLGYGKFSIVSQAAEKYGKIFSYCLPTVNGTGGYLKFGSDAGSVVSFTPLAKKSNDTFYYIQVLSISVAGKKLPIRPVVFSDAGMIIDSGTTFTYLPPEAYDALKTAFAEEMKNYTSALPVDPRMDTCYDFSEYAAKNISIDHIKTPSIVFEFSDNVTLRVPDSRILYPFNDTLSQVCLAFVRNDKPSYFGVYGYLHQQTVDVVYDVANGKLGFGAGRCT